MWMRARVLSVVAATALATSAFAPVASVPASAAAVGSPAAVACSPGTTAMLLGWVWRCQKLAATNVFVAVGVSTTGPAGELGVCSPGDWVQILKERLDCRSTHGGASWTGARRGALAGKADSWIQSRPAALPGSCKKTSWLMVSGVRVACATGKGSRAWTAATASRPITPAERADNNLHTLSASQVNTVFQVWPTFHPEIAQSLVVDRSMTVSDVTVWPEEAQFANPAFWSMGNSPQDQTWYVKDATPIPATTTVSLYRADSLSDLGTSFSLASGFARVATATTTNPLRMTMPYSIAFPSPVALTSGRYVVVFSFSIPDSRLLDFRLSGRQSGNNTTIGENHDTPSDCVYTSAEDGYSQGRAYKGIGSGLQSLPSPMVATATVGFGTSFVQQEAKVHDCSRVGVYHDVWNPGDIRVSFTTTEVPKPEPSKTSPLPAAAYAGMACDPNDPRLTGLLLANGVGPEARAASACVQLDWLSGAAKSTRPITVQASPSVPSFLVDSARAGIAAGERLNGRYGSADRTYDMLISADPSWACTEGSSIYDAGAVGVSQHATPWAQQQNSGCPGSSSRNGGWLGAITGPTGAGYFAWTELQVSELTKTAASNEGSPSWYLRFLAHEFAHAIQWQRAANSSVSSVSSFGDIESPGSWFSEGQAQYLGFTAGSLTTTTPDMRGQMLAQLRERMAAHGLSSLDIAAHYPFNDMDLIYSSGYFAYEYLLAHFGSSALWNSWTLWNSSTCATPHENACWRAHSEQAFGVPADTLVAGINAYVNAQLS